jgi:hypothetical protein
MSLLKIITPLNLADEEERFFASASYQPKFLYSWEPAQIRDGIKRLSIYEKLVHAIINQDTAAITKEAEIFFVDEWNDSLLNEAQEVLKQPLKVVSTPSLKELVLCQEEALAKLQIDYDVVVSDQHGFVARPEHKNKRLVISKYATYHFFSMESSVRHDGVHIIRYLNGKHNQIKRSANYLPTEEGLASYMQDYGGSEPNNSLYQHAAEYVVTDVCRKGSLRDGVEYLISIGFPEKLAWQRAVRHKFGFVDTSRPGDIMKPAMYFANSQKIKALSDDEKMRLMVGKISIEELPAYPEYRGRFSQEELTEFFNLGA